MFISSFLKQLVKSRPRHGYPGRLQRLDHRRGRFVVTMTPRKLLLLGAVLQGQREDAHGVFPHSLSLVRVIRLLPEPHSIARGETDVVSPQTLHGVSLPSRLFESYLTESLAPL